MSTVHHPASTGRTTHGARRRAVRPDPLRTLARLTGRDRDLLELLAEHRVLATEHIAAWLFPTLDAAQRRLVTLYRLGVLNRFRTPQLDQTVTSLRYTLGPHGAAVLAAMRGTTAPQPAAVHRRTLRLAAHPDLRHLLGINHLLSQLAVHSRTQPRRQLTLCWGEPHATQACGTLARPDALFVWDHPTSPGSSMICCLEYDTGTERLAALLDKLPGYADLALAGGPRLPMLNPDTEQDHTTSPPPLWVLLLLPTPRREAHLRERLASHHSTHLATHPAAQSAAGAAAMYVATSTDEHTAALGGPAAGEVWLPLHTSTRVSLTDLAARPTRPGRTGVG